MKLYQITEQHKELEKLADESEEMAQAVADTMESIDGDFQEKALSVMHVVLNMSSDVDALDDEIKRLSDRKKAIKNRQDGIRDYLRIQMEATGINKISCPIFTITLKQGRDIVQIDDEDIIPTDYLNIKTSVAPMKREILADLKEGKDIPGASMVKSKSSIVIK